MDCQYSDIDKAQWILEHGHPDIIYTYERVSNTIYKRVSLGSKNIPPWININERTVIKETHNDRRLC
jgi:hypothetical protein